MPVNSDTNFTIIGQVENSCHEIYNITMPNGNNIVGRLSGKLRFNKIQILPGDYVKISISVNDTSHGLITHRLSDSEGRRLFKNSK